MIIDGKKYYHVFTAGVYTQANITESNLQEIANTYDPVNFHEAPVWLGHPDDNHQGTNEPEALAWIDSVVAIGDKLYVSFAYVSEKMKQLIESQAFKRVSVEIVKYNTDDGKQFMYLYAVGLTNRPAVKGLDPISFAGKKFNSAFAQRYSYNEKFINYKHSNQMNQYLIKVAESLGIDLTKFTTDSSLQEAIALKFIELKVKAETPAVKAEDGSEVAKLQARLDELNAERVAELVDTAVKEFKILPAQKDQFVELGKTNFNILKTSIANMTVHKDLADKVIKTGDVTKLADLSAEKFKKADGKKLTYVEYMKMDPRDQDKFTSEEVAELKRETF